MITLRVSSDMPQEIWDKTMNVKKENMIAKWIK